MIHEPSDSSRESEANQRAVDEIVSRGPRGALAVAGIAALLVTAMWFAFYFFVFVPRAA
jgi:hypothetical protein